MTKLTKIFGLAAMVLSTAFAGERAEANLSAPDGWKVEQVGGGKGELAVAEGVGYNGADGLRLTADLSAPADKNGTYTALSRELTDLNAASIDLMVFKYQTTGAKKMTLRITDAGGQVFQERRELTADNSPHEVTLEIGAGWSGKTAKGNFKKEHWGGANDGIVHQPLKAITLSLPKPAADADDKPTLIISDCEAVYTVN